MCNKESYFYKLSQINVSDKVEKKAGLSYLSWAFAWSEIKKEHPESNYRVFEHPETYCNYFHDNKTAWVKVGVTVEGIEHIEYLPIMDLRNKSVAVENITSFDVNKAMQRALTKAIARHGLGLYIYAGEDLPEENDESKAEKMQQEQEQLEADKTAIAKDLKKIKTVEELTDYYKKNTSKYKATPQITALFANKKAELKEVAVA
mgnify:CR=1 FL=1